MLRAIRCHRPLSGSDVAQVFAAVEALRNDLLTERDTASLVSPHSHNASYEHLAMRYITANMPQLCGWYVRSDVPIQRFKGDLSGYEWDARIFLNTVRRSSAEAFTLRLADGRDFIVYGGLPSFQRPPVVKKRALSPFRHEESGRLVKCEYVGIFEVTRMHDWTRRVGDRTSLLPRLETRLHMSFERASAVASKQNEATPFDISHVVGVIGVCGVDSCMNAVNDVLTRDTGRRMFPMLHSLFAAGRFIFIRVPVLQLASVLNPQRMYKIQEPTELDTSGTSGSPPDASGAVASNMQSASASGGDQLAAGGGDWRPVAAGGGGHGCDRICIRQSRRTSEINVHESTELATSGIRGSATDNRDVAASNIPCTSAVASDQLPTSRVTRSPVAACSEDISPPAAGGKHQNPVAARNMQRGRCRASRRGHRMNKTGGHMPAESETSGTSVSAAEAGIALANDENNSAAAVSSRLAPNGDDRGNISAELHSAMHTNSTSGRITDVGIASAGVTHDQLAVVAGRSTAGGDASGRAAHSDHEDQVAAGSVRDTQRPPRRHRRRRKNG